MSHATVVVPNAVDIRLAVAIDDRTFGLASVGVNNHEPAAGQRRDIRIDLGRGGGDDRDFTGDGSGPIHHPGPDIVVIRRVAPGDDKGIIAQSCHRGFPLVVRHRGVHDESGAKSGASAIEHSGINIARVSAVISDPGYDEIAIGQRRDCWTRLISRARRGSQCLAAYGVVGLNNPEDDVNIAISLRLLIGDDETAPAQWRDGGVDFIAAIARWADGKFSAGGHSCGGVFLRVNAALAGRVSTLSGGAPDDHEAAIAEARDLRLRLGIGGEGIDVDVVAETGGIGPAGHRDRAADPLTGERRAGIVGLQKIVVAEGDRGSSSRSGQRPGAQRKIECGSIKREEVRDRLAIEQIPAALSCAGIRL